MEAFLLNITDSLKRLYGRRTKVTSCPQGMQKAPQACESLMQGSVCVHIYDTHSSTKVSKAEMEVESCKDVAVYVTWFNSIWR